MFGQDSLTVNSHKSINQDSLIKEQMFFTVAPRVGVGIHRNPYFEIGVSGIYIDVHHLAFNAASAYSTLIFHQTSKDSSFDTYGFKVGVQSSWAIFMWGIEVKYLSFDTGGEYYIPLKLGLSLLDFINVEYAVNVGGTSGDMIIQSKHMIGINFSMNRKIYKTIKRTF
jgi:hypothetical protein